MKVVNVRTRIINRLKKLVIRRTGHFWPFSTHTFDSLVDVDGIIQHLGPKPKEEKETWTIDHIVPLAFFDFRYPEQVSLAFVPENHEWTTGQENNRKGCRIPEEIPPKLTRLLESIRKNFNDDVFLGDFILRSSKNRSLVKVAERYGLLEQAKTRGLI